MENKETIKFLCGLIALTIIGILFLLMHTKVQADQTAKKYRIEFAHSNGYQNSVVDVTSYEVMQLAPDGCVYKKGNYSKGLPSFCFVRRIYEYR